MGDVEEANLLRHCLERHQTPVAWEHPQQAAYVTSKMHGGRLFTRTWLPKDRLTPVGCIFLTHGVNEHIGRYCDVAHSLTKQGFAVLGHDHWGHGLSGGFKGDIESLAYLINDLKQLVQAQRQVYRDVPFFLLAHSMGTIVAFHAAYELQAESPGLLRGVVFSGCALVPGPSAASPFGVRCLFCLTQNEWASASIGGLMARIQPRGPLAPVVEAELTHDRAELEALRRDPLHNRGPLLNRTGNEILKGCQVLRERLPTFTLPFVALHGASDTITYPIGSQVLFDQAGSAVKTLKFYPGLAHEIFLETAEDRALVLADVQAFLSDMLLKKHGNGMMHGAPPAGGN